MRPPRKPQSCAARTPFRTPPPRPLGVLTLLLATALTSCDGTCPEDPEHPQTTRYRITSAEIPELYNATVDVSTDLLVIRYHYDGVPVTVTYELDEE